MATLTTDTYRDFTVQKAVTPAATAVSITTTASTHDTCRAVYIGAGDNYDFYIGGAWIVFKGTAEGSILPVRASGARHNTGSTAPDAGDIVFLY